jgi:methylated-DNA-[protein]-cysteine S-methyltransferase
MRITLDRLPSPIGPLLLACDDADDALVALMFDDHEPRLRRLLAALRAAVVDAHAPESVLQPLRAYFAGDLAAPERLRVRASGTEFQRRVWDALRGIPAGTTASYATVAARIGRAAAVRAVGLANGANPVAIVVPCHRVIGANATLTGYGGGLARKRWLLEHEGVRLASAGTPSFRTVRATPAVPA